jgi:hypothetical protein
MKRLGPLLATAVAFTIPASAQAATPKQYRLRPYHHCKAGYARKVERVKVHRHHRTYRVRVTFCVRVVPKVAPKPAAPTLTAPSAVLPTGVKLHAHLDPTLVQSPNNPFAISYRYSASATRLTAPTIEAPEPSLPEGILNLYADGLLKCSINVGGSTTGGECPVTETMGTHTVVTTYASGQASATETSAEQVNPFPTIATTTALAITPTGCEEEVKERGIEHTSEGNRETNVIEHRCSYLATGSSNVGQQPLTLIVGGTAIPGGNPGTCHVTVGNLVEHVFGMDKPDGWTAQACGLSAGGPSGPGGNPSTYTGPLTWTLTARGAANPAFGEGGGGWTASESGPTTLTS